MAINREKVLVVQPCLILCNPMDYIDCQIPLSMGFSRQEYWSGLPFLSPGDLPNPEIETRSPTLQADSLPSDPQGKPTERMAIKTGLPPPPNGLRAEGTVEFHT